MRIAARRVKPRGGPGRFRLGRAPGRSGTCGAQLCVRSGLEPRSLTQSGLPQPRPDRPILAESGLSALERAGARSGRCCCRPIGSSRPNLNDAKAGIRAICVGHGCGNSERDVARLLHTRRSAMTFMVAARTSAQRAAFDTVSIVPSISMAWASPPGTMTTARTMWARRHVRGRSPNRRRSAAKSATAKMAHIAITPKGENGVGDENIRASTMSGGLVIQRPTT